VNLNNGNTNNNTKVTLNYARCVRPYGNGFYAAPRRIGMAKYEHLTIYIKTYEFTKLNYRIVRHFRKEYKYTLGEELQKISWSMLDEIIRTNSLPDAGKKEGIGKLSILFDSFKVRFRLAYEIGLIKDKKFAAAQRQIEEIGKMIGGWAKWAEGAR
jgi:hypothetical protein